MSIIILAFLAFFALIGFRVVMLLEKNNRLLKTIADRTNRQVDIMETPSTETIVSTSRRRDPGFFDRVADRMAP